nr:MAG: helix-turn-helix domain protein [Bacteriophage sp.]
MDEYIIVHHKEGMMEILTWQARTEKNVTLKQLEKMTGISKTTLNTIENGLTSPTLRQLEAIAIALDTKISALYDSEYK